MKLTNLIRITAAIMLAIMPICASADDNNNNQKTQSRNTVAGHRICVFNGTEQDARTQAQAAMASVSKNFENMPANLTYNAPIWKVLVGQCINRTEATILLQRIRKIFPAAFIVNERINTLDFTTAPSFTLPNRTTNAHESTAVAVTE